MENNEKLKELKFMLLDNGYNSYAQLLDVFHKKNSKILKVAIVGEILKGKSTFINKLLGKNLLSTGIIPNENIITIRYGIKEKIICEKQGIMDISLLNTLNEIDENCILEINDDMLKDNIELYEFPGIGIIKDENDFLSMTEIYKCDTAILIISAEQLFSENECNFIENYIKYISEENLLVVINKIDLVNPLEYNRVIEYAITQMNNKFPGIKYAFLNQNVKSLDNYDNLILDIDSIKSIIKKWNITADRSNNCMAIANVISKIRECLELERNMLEQIRLLDLAEIKKLNLSIEKEKELATTKYEKTLLDLESRKKNTISIITNEIEENINNIKNQILHEYDNTDNKVEWYEKKLKLIWEQEVKQLSTIIDNKVMDIIQNDINWLSQSMDICEDYDSDIHLKQKHILFNQFPQKLKPYDKIKKIISLEIGASIVMGFCLFRIVGVAICLGGGLFINSLVMQKSAEQNKKLREYIIEEIRGIKCETIKISKNEIEEVYTKIKQQYSTEIRSLIFDRYKPIEEIDNATIDKINKIDVIIEKLD